MTRDEQDRIDKLIADIAEWRIEMNESINFAIRTHSGVCLAMNLDPIKEALERLLLTEEARRAQMIQRTRWLKIAAGAATALVAIIGMVTPYILGK